MTERLEAAINNLYNLDQSLSPIAFSNAREAAIVEGLNALAENFNKRIEVTRIDSNGELKFNIEGAHLGVGQFGEGLASVLSKVATRCGMTAFQGTVLPENNWTRINHFEAERLLKIVGKEMFDIDPENSQASRLGM